MSSPLPGRYTDNFRVTCSDGSKYTLEKGGTGHSNKTSAGKAQQDHSTCKDGTCVVTWKPGKHAV